MENRALINSNKVFLDSVASIVHVISHVITLGEDIKSHITLGICTYRSKFHKVD